MIIEVYKDKKLDGIAYGETNEYVKANDKSVFDSLKKPIDYKTLEIYALSGEKTSSLEELDANDKTLDGLEFTFGLSEAEQNAKKENTSNLSDEEKKKLKEELKLVREVLKSIIFIDSEKTRRVVWMEPFLNNMACKVIPLKDMYYKCPPDAVDEYDEGYRFTQKQLDMLMDWILKGKEHEKDYLV